MSESGPSRCHRPEEAQDDDECLRRMRADDPLAFAQLAQSHWHALVGYGYDLVGSVDAAQDLAQDAMIGLWERRREFEGRGALRAYLMTAVRRLALNELRGRRLRERPDVVDRIRAIRADPVLPDAVVEERGLRRAIEGALRQLPARRREALVLVRFHGLSYREAADVMGVSTQTVANQVCTALSELRALLAPFGDER
jgi:RNA polymerase sigma-70 factor (ECF subfamily)